MDGSIYLLGALLLPGIVLIAIYNGLVSRRNAVDNASASLDANLQKRYDLIPSVVETVRGYMVHERETLEAVVRLRQETAGRPAGAIAQNDPLAPALRQVMAVAEGYPQLKASTNFLHLQATLNEVEEQISASRRAFNACVNDYNTTVESFPSNLVANSFGFKRRDFFRAGAGAEVAPDMSGKF